MSTREHNPTRRTRRWAIPGVALAAGVGYLVAGVLGDNLAFGVFGLALMVVVAGAVLLAGRRSEYVEGLVSGRDERINSHDRDASLVAGMTVLLATLVMFMVEIARGDDGSPYYQLGALGGATYVVTLVGLRLTR